MNHQETLVFPREANITPEARDLIERSASLPFLSLSFFSSPRFMCVSASGYCVTCPFVLGPKEVWKRSKHIRTLTVSIGNTFAR
jgi:hypothetical protein